MDVAIYVFLIIFLIFISGMAVGKVTFANDIIIDKNQVTQECHVRHLGEPNVWHKIPCKGEE